MSGTTFTSVNPARPAEVVGTFDAASKPRVRQAVEDAAAAQRSWASQTVAERATLIGGIAHAIARRTQEFVELIVRENGKLTSQAAVEVRKSAEQFHFASQLCYLVEGTTYPEEEAGTFTFTSRLPVGVVVAITPWNFPLSLPARKIAAAVAAGNAVVFKPSPVTAAVGQMLVDTCHDAGLPDGVLTVVHGDAPDAMAELVGHAAVRAITFTGSDRVGAALHRQTHAHARLQFELGGHNAAVVSADADLGKASRDIAAASFGQAGQTCTATDRVLVERPAYDSLCQLLATRTQQLLVGPGDAAGVSCGPVATAAQKERLDTLAAAGREAGKVLAEGRLRDGAEPDGYWVPPAAFTDLPAGHPLLTAEVFGPLLSVLPVDSVAEATEIVNASEHGLVTSLHTRDLAAAHRFARAVTCGVVKVNGKTTGNGIAPPFGGWKSSSSGAFPEGGRQALDFFTDTKTVYLSPE